MEMPCLVHGQQINKELRRRYFDVLKNANSREDSLVKERDVTPCLAFIFSHLGRSFVNEYC
jgi:hypothetical protein